MSIIRPMTVSLGEDQAVVVSLEGTDGSFTIEYDTNEGVVLVLADLPDGLEREGVIYEERFKRQSHTVADALDQAVRYLELARRVCELEFGKSTLFEAELKRLAELRAMPLGGVSLQESIPEEADASPEGGTSK